MTLMNASAVLLSDITTPDLLEASNSTSNTTTQTLGVLTDYAIASVAINAPFILIFIGLFIATLVSYVGQFKKLKHNQHILFNLLFIMEWCVAIRVVTFIVSELCNLIPNKVEANMWYNIVKAFDRTMIPIAMFSQYAILAFVCHVFIETSHSADDLTDKGRKIAYYLLTGILVVVAILFFIQCIINYVFHGYNGSPVKNTEVVEGLSYATYVLPSVFIAFGIFCLAVMLNYLGVKIFKSLRQYREKILHQAEGDHILTKEQQNTFKIKQHALHMTLGLQIGMTAALILQLIAVFFIPIGRLYWIYVLYFFQMFNNFGSLIFILLLFTLYTPLKEVQKLFRRHSQESHLIPLTSLGSPQDHHLDHPNTISSTTSHDNTKEEPSKNQIEGV